MVNLLLIELTIGINANLLTVTLTIIANGKTANIPQNSWTNNEIPTLTRCSSARRQSFTFVLLRLEA